MTRLILWLLIIYFAWKIVQRFLLQANRKTTSGNSTTASAGKKNDFSQIPDAEFEDVTPKPPSETTKQQ